jgi:hypothetical protein
MDEAFARSAVEQLYRLDAILLGAGSSAFESCTQCGFLSAIADGCRARFPHVLFR